MNFPFLLEGRALGNMDASLPTEHSSFARHFGSAAADKGRARIARIERGFSIRISSAKGPVSNVSLRTAERLFSKWAIQLLLRHASKLETAGPRLHLCIGRALTPQEDGPATTESEREQYDCTRSIT